MAPTTNDGSRSRGWSPSRSPEGLEAHVTVLREDVARILGELERRYRHLTAVPRRMGEGSAALGRMVRRNKVPFLGVAALGGVGVLLLARMYAQRRARPTYRLRRALAWR